VIGSSSELLVLVTILARMPDVFSGSPARPPGAGVAGGFTAGPGDADLLQALSCPLEHEDPGHNPGAALRWRWTAAGGPHQPADVRRVRSWGFSSPAGAASSRGPSRAIWQTPCPDLIDARGIASG
jgi:hypothetical protein